MASVVYSRRIQQVFNIPDMVVYDESYKRFRDVINMTYLDGKLINMRLKAFKGEFTSQDGFDTQWLDGYLLMPKASKRSFKGAKK